MLGAHQLADMTLPMPASPSKLIISEMRISEPAEKLSFNAVSS